MAQRKIQVRHRCHSGRAGWTSLFLVLIPNVTGNAATKIAFNGLRGCGSCFYKVEDVACVRSFLKNLLLSVLKIESCIVSYKP